MCLGCSLFEQNIFAVMQKFVIEKSVKISGGNKYIVVITEVDLSNNTINWPAGSVRFENHLLSFKAHGPYEQMK